MALYPKDLLYQESHEWVLIKGQIATCGISDFAQEELNDIVYVELPEVGDDFDQGEAFAVVESVKAASDIFMPLGGQIIAINTALEETPQLVNDDPYEEGWLIKLRIGDEAEIASLMDAETYRKLCEEEAA